MQMMTSCWSDFLNLPQIVPVVNCSKNTLRSFFNLLLLDIENWCIMNTQRGCLLLLEILCSMGLGSVVGVEVLLGVGSPGMLGWLCISDLFICGLTWSFSQASIIVVILACSASASVGV